MRKYQLQDQGAALVMQSDYDGAELGKAFLDPGNPTSFGNFSWPQEPTYQANNNVGSPTKGFIQQPSNNRPNPSFTYSDDAQLPAVAKVPTYLEPVPTLPLFHAPHEILPQLPHIAVEAEILENTDGGFFCSQLGCNATYRHAGDCRRHLKKHNGPFFRCTQGGCDMKFYRHDKLRAHLKQGHGITITAPRRGRRGAN